MATIEVAPLVLKNVDLTIGTDDYKKHVDQVTFTPSAQTQTWTGLGGNTHTDVATATWTVTLSGAQDWDTANSLSRYLYANEGSSVAMTFRPRTGTGPSFTATVVITPGQIGGQGNAFANGSVTLGSSKPTLVEAAAVPTIASALPSAVAAGGLVTITGARFTGVTGATGVKFGATNATTYIIVSDSTIVATMPTGSAGAANITITNATGTSTAFSYTRGA